MTKLAIVSLAFVSAFALTVQAQSQNQNQTASNSSQDTRFVQQAVQSHVAAIQMGKMGAQSQNSQIRQLAKDLESSHRQGLTELQSIAQGQGFQTSQTLGRHYQEQLQDLQQTSGKAFDRQFAVDTLKDQGRAIEFFQKEAQQGQNPQLKQYAQKMLPELQQHFQTSQTTAKDVGVSDQAIAALLKEYPSAVGGAQIPGGQGQGSGSSQNQPKR